MARKAGLPPLLVNFILTHHGTTRTEYFFRNYRESHPDEEVDESLFQYPGPRPRTKEETILMLADSIEAACKSLKSPTQEALFGLIDKIVDGKVRGGQLEDSRISFQELEQCKIVFRQIMKSVHHVRIAYPEDKEE
jgi:membrane-associated HD superfamily phosphohydrolase